jgi:hypothetical protein
MISKLSHKSDIWGPPIHQQKTFNGVSKHHEVHHFPSSRIMKGIVKIDDSDSFIS